MALFSSTHKSFNDRDLNCENPDTFPPEGEIAVDNTTCKRVRTPLCTVGRAEGNDIVLTGDVCISRSHFRIMNQDDVFALQDVCSYNGTYVNNAPVLEPCILQSEDLITIGLTTLKFVISSNNTPFLIDVSGPRRRTTTSTGDDNLETTQAPASDNVPRQESRTSEQPKKPALRMSSELRASHQLIEDDSTTNQATLIMSLHNMHVTLHNMYISCRELSEECRSKQIALENTQERISHLESLIDRVSQDDFVIQTCIKLLFGLGWTVGRVPTDPYDLRLISGGACVAVARLCLGKEGINRDDITNLQASQTLVWCDQLTEPKGILLGHFNPEETPLGGDFGGSMVHDYAKKKKICLISHVQLLSLHRKAVASATCADWMKKLILSTDGAFSEKYIDID